MLFDTIQTVLPMNLKPILSLLLLTILSRCMIGQAICSTTPDFFDLTSPCVVCNYGGYYQDLYPPYTAHGNPFQNTGIAYDRHTVINKQGYDPHTGNKLPLIPPGETQSIRLENAGIGAQAEAITYHFQPQPNATLLQVKFAVVMEDPGHIHENQPRFVIKILNEKDSLLETCAQYDVRSAADIPGFQTYLGLGVPVRWRPWTTIAIDLSSYINKDIKVQFVNYDCLEGGHFGYAYYTVECLPSKLNLTACASDKVTLEAPPFCESYLWTNGDTTQTATFTMPSSGVLSESCLIRSVTGCEFTLNAYISPNPPTHDMTIYDTICESEKYDKNQFDLPPQFRIGTHSHVNEFYDASTCLRSSTAYLHLTVKQKYFPINDITCSGLDYVKYGFSHLNPQPGIIRDTQIFKRTDGCDSIVCLNLIVSRTVLNHPPEITGNPQPCSGNTEVYAVLNAEEYINFTWDVPDKVTIRGASSSGQQTSNTASIVLQFTDESLADTLKVYAANGCGGTLVKLFVEPNPSYYLSIIDSMCSGLNYKKNGFDIPRQDSIGFKIFTQQYSTQNGCDSVRSLYLNIYRTPEIALRGSADVICSDDSVQLQVTYADYEKSEEEPYRIKIGDILCDDDSIVAVEDYLAYSAASGETAVGIVFWISPDTTHGWAVGIESYDARWSTSTAVVPGVSQTNGYDSWIHNDTVGYQNTKIIRTYGNAATYPAAWAVDFDNGWFLPAVTQARILWGTMKLIEQSFIIAGAPQGLRLTEDFWTSTEYGSRGGAIEVSSLGNLSFMDDGKLRVRLVRPIKRFSISKK